MDLPEVDLKSARHRETACLSWNLLTLKLRVWLFFPMMYLDQKKYLEVHLLAVRSKQPKPACPNNSLTVQ